jgi:ectoine hydroxylase-related dioxygenase (phytanoyl-CoA dioxygenase family)
MMGPKYWQGISAEVGADERFAPREEPQPRLRALINHVEQHGYAIIRDAFTPEEVAEAKSEVARLEAAKAAQAEEPNEGKGRNTFEGLRTQRIYALAAKSRVFDKFALHPDVLALNDHFLEAGYLLSSFQSINIQPGEKPQTLHYDDGYITVPRPHQPFSAAIMVALDAYTAANGATVVVPGSHTWGSDRTPDAAEAQPVTMPSGSMLYFPSTLWHGGGRNVSGTGRLALTVQYCQPWARQLENQMMAVDWEQLDAMPPRLVDMLGYKVGAPFVGHVDGRSPRVAVARALQQRRQGKL